MVVVVTVLVSMHSSANCIIRCVTVASSSSHAIETLWLDLGRRTSMVFREGRRERLKAPAVSESDEVVDVGRCEGGRKCEKVACDFGSGKLLFDVGRAGVVGSTRSGHERPWLQRVTPRRVPHQLPVMQQSQNGTIIFVRFRRSSKWSLWDVGNGRGAAKCTVKNL